VPGFTEITEREREKHAEREIETETEIEKHSERERESSGSSKGFGVRASGSMYQGAEKERGSRNRTSCAARENTAEEEGTE
jgi:hypothetical protein